MILFQIISYFLDEFLKYPTPSSSALPLPPTSPQTNVYDGKYDNCTKLRSGIDTITLVLKRDKRVLDFGFSISDRLYGTGVYVNKIRANGPAELEGTLIPCMRIYKVNFKRRKKLRITI